MMLISPLQDVPRCGSSSRLVLGINLPTRVMRGHPWILNIGPSISFCSSRSSSFASALKHMERNLVELKRLTVSSNTPPTRKSGQQTGHPTTIAMAVASMTGDSATNASDDKITSCVRRPIQYRRCLRRFSFRSISAGLLIPVTSTLIFSPHSHFVISHTIPTVRPLIQLQRQRHLQSLFGIDTQRPIRQGTQNAPDDCFAKGHFVCNSSIKHLFPAPSHPS